MNETQAVQHGAEIIKRGGIVSFPTETVYGLGADAFNPLAVARIFEAKRQTLFRDSSRSERRPTNTKWRMAE